MARSQERARRGAAHPTRSQVCSHTPVVKKYTSDSEKYGDHPDIRNIPCRPLAAGQGPVVSWPLHSLSLFFFLKMNHSEKKKKNAKENKAQRCHTVPSGKRTDTWKNVLYIGASPLGTSATTTENGQ
jgi:hypothetical protein